MRTPKSTRHPANRPSFWRCDLLPSLALVALALSLGFSGLADEPLPSKIRVLFIGNSYTYTFSIPVQIATLFAPQGVTFEHESDTPGGSSLSGHWSDGFALAAIRRGGWDYVVLQDQSSQPLNNRSALIASVAQFDAEIRKVGARTLVYQTWPLRDSYTGTSPNLTSANGAYINETYRQAAVGVGAILVPVGTGWPAAINTIGQSTMYISDGSHPSQPGAYLSALTFFRTLTRLNTTGLLTKSGISGVSQTQAGQAQAAADGVTLAPVVAPIFNLAAGTYAGAQRARLDTVTPQATIYYTTNGSTPTTSSPSTADGGVISFSQTITLKAIAVSAGISSGITTATYTITSTNGQTLFGSGSVSNLAVAWPGNPANLAGSNAGFENGAASPWGYYPSPAPSPEPVNGTFVHSGAYAVQLSDKSIQRYVNSLASNTLYEARIWYRYGTDVASTAFTAQAFSTPSVQVTGVMSNRGLPLAWHRDSRRFTTSATATSVQLVIQRNSDTGAYDDLEFYKVPNGYELGTRFRSSVGGKITALRVWRPPNGPTSYDLRLWDSGGVEREHVSVAGLTATGWVEVPIPTPRVITANATYTVSYNLAEGGFYQGALAGLEQPVTNNALSTFAGSNAVYTLARATYPNTSTSTDFSADVRFVAFTPIEAWRNTYFTQAQLGNPALEATLWGDLADPDDDGLPNILEYGVETLPNAFNTLPPGLAPTELPLALTFKRARTDVTYVVQGSSDLKTWSNIPYAPVAVGQTTTVYDTPPPNATSRFLHLQITSP